MKVMIFGGGGFIGRSLTTALLDRGDEVHVVDNFMIHPEGSVDSRASFTHADVTDVGSVKGILNDAANDWGSYQLVIFQARQGYGLNYKAYAETNVLASYALHEAISGEAADRRELQEYGIDGILLASSQAIYEPGPNVLESHSQFPPSVYGITKRQQEEHLYWLAERSMVPFRAMRYSIVLGWGQALQSSESGIMRNWLKSTMAGEPFEVYGDGKQIRDFVHIDDVTRANLAALDYDETGAFNVYGFARSILEMAEIFKKEAGQDGYNILNRAVRPGGEYSITSKSERMDLLDWKPELAPEDQIRSFLDFATSRRDTGDRSIPG